ncbi:MAG: hypothetical protein J6V50_00245 [Clostridia bacterium]|nr:hypothetical protein [Clostridia bacterium]
MTLGKICAAINVLRINIEFLHNRREEILKFLLSLYKELEADFSKQKQKEDAVKLQFLMGIISLIDSYELTEPMVLLSDLENGIKGIPEIEREIDSRWKKYGFYLVRLALFEESYRRVEAIISNISSSLSNLEFELCRGEEYFEKILIFLGQLREFGFEYKKFCEFLTEVVKWYSYIPECPPHMPQNSVPKED